MTIRGEYTSVWDGSVEVISDVEVDLENMEIVEWGVRWMDGEVAEDDDMDELEVLEEEYVYIPDVDLTYTACSAADADWADDAYGNGIITY